MSNEKINNATKEEILENVEFTTDEQSAAETSGATVDEPKQNKFVQLKNKALGFVGKHKFIIGVGTGVAAIVAADRAMNTLKGRYPLNDEDVVVDAEFVEINEPTENVEEIDYPQEEVEEVEDAVEE